jgi:serine phosphatase RsbU (regulator of sigma subunit)
MIPNTSPGRFIELFYAEFDSVSGLLRYSNAGTNLALLRRRDGSLLEFPKGGVMLGFHAEAEYDVAEHQMEPGDSLLLCTGGIVRALNPVGFCLGVDRLCVLWQQCADRTPESAILAILAEVQAFRDRALHEEIETFPSLAEAKGQETLRMEAEWLRKHPDQREDLTLVALGSHK